MIAVTDQAASAIRQMTNTEMYPEAGLRITAVEENRFALKLVPHPASEDVTVDAGGANLYLDDDAADALDSATLDIDGSKLETAQFLLVSR
jgi:Fe-S cluster assembly iron-binding protein IscA